ncbi:MAG: SPASM domain-containing protein, partial [Bacteroidetes bacterium]|nr:SPASM domain-containing protein [Bacteroidota bacterium]
CCFDKDATYKVGDLKSESFKDVWESEDLKLFRGSILTNRKQIDICQNCVEGTKIWI